MPSARRKTNCCQNRRRERTCWWTIHDSDRQSRLTVFTIKCPSCHRLLFCVLRVVYKHGIFILSATAIWRESEYAAGISAPNGNQV